MRIELCAGGIGGIAVSDFQADMRVLLSEKESVIASFKAVSNNTGDLSGGVGSLQGAMEDIQARIIQEEAALENARNIQTSMNDFLSLAQRVDAQVASEVNQNKADFYGKYPELRSTSSDEEKAWYEKAWEALCGVGEAIKESFEDGLESIADTLKNAWDGLVEFYKNNKERIWQILIGVAAIAIAVVVTVATGGAALPALAALAKAAITAGLMSAAISGSITAVMALATGESFEDTLDAVMNSAIDGFCSGFMIGGIFAGFSQIVSCFSPSPSAGKPYPKQEGGKYSDVKKLSDGATEQVHHMPADSINGMKHSDGPSILMEAADHKMTASFDNKAGSTAYRLQQKQLIEAGRFREAFNMDVANIRYLFGNKYDGAIQKTTEYIEILIQKGIIK